MKKFLFIAACLCCILPTRAEADLSSGIYIAPKLVYSFVNTDISGVGGSSVEAEDSSVSVGLALGYDFNVAFNLPMRIELDWNMHSQIEDTGRTTGIGSADLTTNIGIQALFLNAYYDLHNASKFTPYIGAGIGIAAVDVESFPRGSFTLHDKSTGNFAWNMSLGVSYAFTPSLGLDFSYRYAHFGKGETENINNITAKTDTIDAHQGILAVRYTF